MMRRVLVCSAIVCLVCTVGVALAKDEQTEFRRSSEKYLFLKTQDRGIYRQVYGMFDNKEDRINLVFTEPKGLTIDFFESRDLPIGKKGSERIALPAGVYPFSLVDASSNSVMCGAVMIYNIDKTLALATLGKAEETALFKPELLEKAKSGSLATHTLKIDDKEVLSYWLGNRTSLYPGGAPTVEVDFSKTPGITSLIIGENDVSDDFRQDLRAFTSKVGLRTGSAEYPFQLTCGDREFVGYVRDMAANEFTAFVSIPCTIPAELLDAAAEGTVSKFTVYSQGTQTNRVAEIVLSGK